MAINTFLITRIVLVISILVTAFVAHELVHVYQFMTEGDAALNEISFGFGGTGKYALMHVTGPRISNNMAEHLSDEIAAYGVLFAYVLLGLYSIKKGTA